MDTDRPYRLPRSLAKLGEVGDFLGIPVTVSRFIPRDRAYVIGGELGTAVTLILGDGLVRGVPYTGPGLPERVYLLADHGVMVDVIGIDGRLYTAVAGMLVDAPRP